MLLFVSCLEAVVVHLNNNSRSTVLLVTICCCCCFVCAYISRANLTFLFCCSFWLMFCFGFVVGVFFVGCLCCSLLFCCLCCFVAEHCCHSSFLLRDQSANDAQSLLCQRGTTTATAQIYNNTNDTIPTTSSSATTTATIPPVPASPQP